MSIGIGEAALLIAAVIIAVWVLTRVITAAYFRSKAAYLRRYFNHDESRPQNSKH